MNREKFQVVLALTRTLLLLAVFASVSIGDGFAQSIETFDVPNGTQTQPTGINAAGQITGYYVGQDNSYHGFLRELDGTTISFDAPGGAGIKPLAINAAGQITGYYVGQDNSYHGFVRELDGTIISFDAPGGAGIKPLAINDAGQITGSYSSGDHGFLRQPDGTIIAIDDDPSDPNHPGFCGGYPCRAYLYPQSISPTGQITGDYTFILYIDTYQYGFLRQPDGTIVRFGTSAASINAAGQITGYFHNGVYDPNLHGFLRQADATITPFDPEHNALSWIHTSPQAINTKGQITGFFTPGNGETTHGFLRESDGTIVTFDVPNSKGTYATGMNDVGDITGYYFDAIGLEHGFIRHSTTDTIPPVTTATVSPGPNSTGWNSTDVTVNLNSTDNKPGGTGVKQIQYALAGAQTLDTQTVPGSTASVTISTEGLTTLTYFGTDKAGNVEQAKTLTVQIDKTPPVISGMPASGCTLWPPNHKLVGVATVTAADALSGLTPGSFQVTGSSNEPSDPNNPDVVITPNGSGGYDVQLRAERLGSGSGRVYTLQATATNLAGNTATATAGCVVPPAQVRVAVP
jgi:hypothetical protein